MTQRKPRRSRTGRPTKLTPAVRAAICRDLELAVPLKYAAEANGVPESTVYDWIARGESGTEPYADFAHAVTRSIARSVVKLTRKALAGGSGSSAAQWNLERRFRQYYGPVQRLEHSGPAGGAIPIQIDDIRKLSDEELRALAKLDE
jgi:hypothetical protein